MKRNRKRSRLSFLPTARRARSALAVAVRAPWVGLRAVGRWFRRRRRRSEAAPVGPAATPAALGPDLVLVMAVLGLVGLGMVMVYSSSAVFAAARYGTATYFLKRNLVYGLLGLAAFYAGWRLDYGLYRRLSYPMLLGVFLLLVALLIPGLGTNVDGATRWFHIAGISLQPSEPAKFALVVYLAHSLTKKREVVKSFSVGFLPHLCVAGLMGLLVLRQPDLGTAAILGLVTLLVLFVAGTKLSYIVISLLAAAPFCYQLIVGTPWRLRRLLAFLDPLAYRQDAGYQITESLISIGSGGLYGLGLGDGKQKLFFLPAAHTDFIFAIVGEELGLVGMGVVVALFVLIIARGLRAAVVARDLFGTYLAYGITAAFGLQALLHVAVVLALVPTKGITLPLVSYGGSALVTTLFCMGVLLNVAARNPEPVSARLARRAAAPGNRRKPVRVAVAEE
jgi:cell division protein FtsW